MSDKNNDKSLTNKFELSNGFYMYYFVNESETISGYGIPSDTGWKWTRNDDLAVEISTGVDMVKNRTMPRFLTLPVLAPKGINQ